MDWRLYFVVHYTVILYCELFGCLFSFSCIVGNSGRQWGSTDRQSNGQRNNQLLRLHSVKRSSSCRVVLASMVGHTRATLHLPKRQQPRLQRRVRSPERWKLRRWSSVSADHRRGQQRPGPRGIYLSCHVDRRWSTCRSYVRTHCRR